MVALVGPTGAGKTTLSYLVPRLYDVTAGAVRIDGHDVRHLTVGDPGRRHRHGHPGRPHVPRHHRRQPALRQARRHRRRAGRRCARRPASTTSSPACPRATTPSSASAGYRLSGGEKQRLALARVLLKSPAIVILDEATAHLDSETELLIQQALAEALAGRTSLVIAHRLSTIQAADQILVLDEGRIVERGTHAELVGREGLYRELYLTQYARTATEAG